VNRPQEKENEHSDSEKGHTTSDQAKGPKGPMKEFKNWFFENPGKHLVFHSPIYGWWEPPKQRRRNQAGEIVQDALDFGEDEYYSQYEDSGTENSDSHEDELDANLPNPETTRASGSPQADPANIRIGGTSRILSNSAKRSQIQTHKRRRATTRRIRSKQLWREEETHL
jgi:hypothetical protein